jgi:hypothetical protein
LSHLEQHLGERKRDKIELYSESSSQYKKDSVFHPNMLEAIDIVRIQALVVEFLAPGPGYNKPLSTIESNNRGGNRYVVWRILVDLWFDWTNKYNFDFGSGTEPKIQGEGMG